MENQELGVKQGSSIIEKTVLVRISFGMLGNSRKVSTKVVSANVNAAILKINKTLVDSKELEAIRTADNKMRGVLAAMCVPYDLGLQLLPRVSIENARNLFLNYREERKQLVQTFVDSYPSLKQQSREQCEALAVELNVPMEYLWQDKDYPSAEYIAGKFYFSWDFLSLTVPDELKIAGKFEEATAELQSKIASVSDEITGIMRESLLELVSHLKDSLEPNSDGKPKRLYATAVSNIQDFLTSFPARNITNDAELDALVAETQKLIHPGLSVDTLKKDESLKSQVHDSMASIGESLTKLVENVPGRKFRNVPTV
jgi:hypothetical protein